MNLSFRWVPELNEPRFGQSQLPMEYLRSLG